MIRFLPIIALLTLIASPTFDAKGEVAINFAQLKEVAISYDAKLAKRLSEARSQNRSYQNPQYLILPKHWLDEGDTDSCLFGENDDASLLGMYCEDTGSPTRICDEYVIDHLPSRLGKEIRQFVAAHKPLLSRAMDDAQLLGHEDIKILSRLLWLDRESGTDLVLVPQQGDPVKPEEPKTTADSSAPDPHHPHGKDPSADVASEAVPQSPTSQRQSLVDWLLTGDRGGRHLLILGLRTQPKAAILVFPCGQIEPPRHMQIEMQLTESKDLRNILKQLASSDVGFTFTLNIHPEDGDVAPTDLLASIGLFFENGERARQSTFVVEKKFPHRFELRGFVSRSVLSSEQPRVRLVSNAPERYQLGDPSRLTVSHAVTYELDWTTPGPPEFNVIRATNAIDHLTRDQVDCDQFPFKARANERVEVLLERLATKDVVLKDLSRSELRIVGADKNQHAERQLDEFIRTLDTLRTVWKIALNEFGDKWPVSFEIRKPLPQKSWLGRPKRSRCEAAALFSAERLRTNSGLSVKTVTMLDLDANVIEVSLRLH